MFADFSATDLEALFAESAGRAQAGPVILAAGSGKRSCGKTTLCWLTALALSRAGYRTILIDSDLAASGLYRHSALPVSEQLLRRFMQRRGVDINILPRRCDNNNLSFITGSPSIQLHAPLSLAAKQKILLHLRQLQADYIIIDCGQGSSYHHLDFFLAADLPIVITLPPISSLLESYQFIRYGFFRKIQHDARHWPELFSQISIRGDITEPGALKTIPSFLSIHRDSHTHLCEVVQKGLASFQPRLIINCADAGLMRERVLAMITIVRQVMGIRVHHWGEVRKDEGLMATQDSAQAGLLLHGDAGKDIAGMIRKRLLAD